MAGKKPHVSETRHTNYRRSEPNAVARDVREQKVTAQAARAVYGVVIEDGTVNPAATSADRDHQRARRRERSRILRDTGGKADLTTARRLDDNLVETAAPDRAGTVVACRHCAEILGGTAADAELALAIHEGPLHRGRTADHRQPG